MRLSFFVCTLVLCACDGGTFSDVDGGVTMDGNTLRDGRAYDGGDGVIKLPSGFRDPNCIDGQVSEAALPISAPIEGISGTIEQMATAILAARYPLGEKIMTDGAAAKANVNGTGTDCIAVFGGASNAFDDVVRRLQVLVHECGHVLDSAQSGDYFYINTEHTFSCDDGDAKHRFGKTFSRSLLVDDAYNAILPACGQGVSPCSNYTSIYLTQIGDNIGPQQGYNSLLEETVQYVNSVAVEYAIVDQMKPGRRVSANDGILNFLWYIMRYLRLARLEHPDVYAFLVTDPCWRRATLTTWGRAWHYLETTKDIPELSALSIDVLMGLVDDNTLLSEIQRLRLEEGCPAPQ